MFWQLRRQRSIVGSEDQRGGAADWCQRESDSKGCRSRYGEVSGTGEAKSGGLERPSHKVSKYDGTWRRGFAYIRTIGNILYILLIVFPSTFITLSAC